MDEYAISAIIGHYRNGATWEQISEVTGHSVEAIKQVVINYIATLEK